MSQSSSPEPVKLGIIGCGRITQVAHLPGIEKADGVQLVALCDGNQPIAHQVAARYGVQKVYADSADLIADPEVEAVIIAIPDRFHRDVVAQALRAGKHVLIEKPLAATEDESRELVELVAATGLVLQVGAMKRHDQGVEYAKEFIADGLGQMRSFNAWYRIGDLRPGIEHTLFPHCFIDPAHTQKETAIKGDRERYLLATHGSHIFDTVRNLCGPITSITAQHNGYGRDHMWQMLVRTENGALGTITITVDVPGEPSEGIEVLGSEGTVRVDIPFPFTKQASRVETYRDGVRTVPVLTDGDPYERQAEAFAQAVRGQRTVTPDAVAGLASVQVIAAAARSVETKSEVTL